MGLDSSFGEHIGFSQEVTFIVHHFQSAQKEIGGIIGISQLVAPVVNDAVLGNEVVIDLVQLRLILLYHRIRIMLVHLDFDQILDAVL